ncbi:MAG: hypothetical protein JNK85_10575 [Verrucomicrobiales bacterium]|nr:hypothetical protein [Verrucomicrobiales bacterium]
MSERAQVRSVEAIDAFRSHLILYLAKVKPVLEEVGADLQRMQLWLESDQRLYWERETHRRARRLEEAQQALLSSRLSGLREASAVEQAAVHRAQRDLEEAREKQRRLKRWSRELGPRTQVLVKQLGTLDSFLAQDMSRAVAWLTEALRALADYSELRVGAGPSHRESPEAAPAGLSSTNAEFTEGAGGSPADAVGLGGGR